MTTSDTILLATRNQGKIRELAKMLTSFQVNVLGLEAFPALRDVEETGSSFEENALLKARYASENSGLTVIADDSGLIVDALDGAPGIHSARFCLLNHENDEGCDDPALPIDERNNRKLLRLLAETPREKRGARFCSAIAVAAPTGEVLTTVGLWEGFICTSPKGENGFGYDPVFLDPECGLTAAELSPYEKNRRSHRARAIQALSELWPSFWAALARNTAKQGA